MHSESATGRCSQCGEPGNARTLHPWQIYGWEMLLCYDVNACVARQVRQHERAAMPWWRRLLSR